MVSCSLQQIVRTQSYRVLLMQGFLTCTRPFSKSSTLRPRYSTSDRLALTLSSLTPSLSSRLPVARDRTSTPPILHSPLTPPHVIISRVKVADVDGGGVKAADVVEGEKDGVMITL